MVKGARSAGIFCIAAALLLAFPTIAFADGVWCRYVDANQNVVFAQSCQVSAGSPLAGCRFDSVLDRRYELRFTAESNVVFEPACRRDRYDSANGVRADIKRWRINDREYLLAELANGERIEFEPDVAAARYQIPPWSPAWLDEGQTGTCIEHQGDDIAETPCTSVPVCQSNSRDAEFLCGTFYKLVDGRSFSEATAGDVTYFDNVRLADGGRDSFGGKTCYRYGQPEKRFCFDSATTVARFEGVREQTPGIANAGSVIEAQPGSASSEHQWSFRQAASDYDYSLIGIDRPQCVLNAGNLEFFWADGSLGWFLIIPKGYHPFDYTGAEAAFDGKFSQSSVYSFDRIGSGRDDQYGILMSAFRIAGDSSRFFVESMADSTTIDIWAGSDIGAASMPIDTDAASKFLNCVAVSQPFADRARNGDGVASESRSWCRYRASDGDVVFNQLCDVNLGEHLPACTSRPKLRSRYEFSFTAQSRAILEPSCDVEKPDRLNGIDVFQDTVIINGRRFYTYRLASGESFQFELAQHLTEANVAPWSDEWRRNGGGVCSEKSLQGASTQTCAKIERLRNPASTGGEFSGYIEYLLADGRRFEVSTVEEQVGVRYELANGISIEAEKFGVGLSVETQQASDADGSDICYRIPEESREFCFELSSDNGRTEESKTEQPVASLPHLPTRIRRASRPTPATTPSSTSEFDPSSIDPSERTAVFAAGQTFEWEGKWADEDARQCQCLPGQIDGFSNDEQFRCGLPPIVLTRSEFTGYELFCEMSEGRFGVRDDQFHLEGTCRSEGQEDIEIEITGFHSAQSGIRLSFDGEGSSWMGDASRFPIKCSSDFDPSLVFDRD